MSHHHHQPSDWWRLTHLFVTSFLADFSLVIVNPAISDVLVQALCGAATDECSLPLYLSGVQQAITGLGAVVVMPMLGNLSDVYGRKNLLLIPLVLAIIPFAILACQRTTNFVYAYYAFKILTGMITDSGVSCLALAYLADNVHEEDRVSAFGIQSGIFYSANLLGTLAARFLSTPRIFQVAAAVSVVAVVYMLLFLKETTHPTPGHCNSLEQPIFMAQDSQIDEVDDYESANVSKFTRKIPSPKDIINLLKSRRDTTFSLLACLSFFKSLADMGIQTFLLYYLKARFHFKKDQFADILLITYAGATISNMLFLPRLGPFIGEESLLILGMFTAFLNVLLNSIAWSGWVPYAVASLGVFFSFATPALRSMVSKQIGPNEQGIGQGCISGITSLAFVASPLILTPLSAIFFAEDAPASFTGFSILCIALAYLIGLTFSIIVKIRPHFARARMPDQTSDIRV